MLDARVVTEAIHKAALFLDQEVPGWYNMIDVATLDMGSCELCAMGQLFGKKNEARLWEILDQALYTQVKKDSTSDHPYLIGSDYCRKKELPVTGAFGFMGKCDWIAEIAERRAQEQVDNQTGKE